MKITGARFVTSFASAPQYMEYAAGHAVPEICVAGRSNVGKSSFINMLTGKKGLARASSQPGRTRLINLFEVNGGEFALADLPGYGYARAPKTEREKWSELAENYLRGSDNLVYALLLVDSTHEPMSSDVQMAEYFYFYRIPFTVVATKCDKLPPSRRAKAINDVAVGMKLGVGNVIAVDERGFGRDAVLSRLDEILSSPGLTGRQTE